MPSLHSTFPQHTAFQNFEILSVAGSSSLFTKANERERGLKEKCQWKQWTDETKV